MTKKATCIWAYVGWVGFIIAICQSCKDECKFHLNQALVWNIFGSGLAVIGIIGMIPYIGWLLDLVLFFPMWVFLIVVWIIAFVGVCHEQEKEMPLLGKINIMNK